MFDIAMITNARSFHITIYVVRLALRTPLHSEEYSSLLIVWSANWRPSIKSRRSFNINTGRVLAVLTLCRLAPRCLKGGKKREKNVIEWARSRINLPLATMETVWCCKGSDCDLFLTVERGAHAALFCLSTTSTERESAPFCCPEYLSLLLVLLKIDPNSFH